MKKMIGIIKPFAFMQTFYIYEDGNKIDAFETSIKDLPNMVLNFTKTYQINEINFTGPEHYIKGIVKKIQEVEIEKYSKNTLIFNYI